MTRPSPQMPLPFDVLPQATKEPVVSMNASAEAPARTPADDAALAAAINDLDREIAAAEMERRRQRKLPKLAETGCGDR
jgi:hypothetical protein